MARVFLSLGSNLGDRVEQLRRAIDLLRQLPRIRFLNASPLYETEPWDSPSGEVVDRAHWFFNCVVEIETSLPPQGLLVEVQAIEGRLGRVRDGAAARTTSAEPRTMDIDILLYGDEVISAPDNLQIPHLSLHERRFVLQPLADLAPDLEHPVLYRTVHELLDDLEDDHRVIASGLPHHWFLH